MVNKKTKGLKNIFSRSFSDFIPSSVQILCTDDGMKSEKLLLNIFFKTFVF